MLKPITIFELCMEHGDMTISSGRIVNHHGAGYTDSDVFSSLNPMLRFSLSGQTSIPVLRTSRLAKCCLACCGSQVILRPLKEL